MSLPNTQTILTSIVAGPLAALYNHNTTKKQSNFENINTSSNTLIIVLIIIFLIISFIITLFTCKAVYNLTDSMVQAACYFLFGSFYMICAIIYYGFSGYKFKLANTSYNSRN
jgi:hypothetical protein